METFVFSLYGFWFWLTRQYRTSRYGEAASTLRSARAYLWNDFASRASTRDRGTLLPHQVEALDILERYSTLASRTTRRFASLRDCCQFITEELTQPQSGLPERRLPVYGRVPSVSFFAPSSGITAIIPAPSRLQHAAAAVRRNARVA